MSHTEFSGNWYTAVVHQWRDYKGKISFAKVRDLLAGFPAEATRILYFPHLMQIDTGRGLVLDAIVESMVLTDNDEISLEPANLAYLLENFSRSLGNQPRVVVVDIGYLALRRHMVARYEEIKHLQRKLVKPPKSSDNYHPKSGSQNRVHIKPQP